MFPGPPELNPLPGPHRAKTERFAQGGLAAFFCGILIVNLTAIGMGIFYAGQEDSDLIAVVAITLMGMILGSMAVMFVCLAILLPCAALAERLAKKITRRRSFMEALYAVGLLAILAVGIRLILTIILLDAVDRWPTGPQFLNALFTGLEYWAIGTPFLLIFWWATKGEQLGYGLRELLRPKNFAAQMRQLFGKPTSTPAAPDA